MAAPKLSPQDRKDMDKFAKYLVYKCIQIIVQSRLGEKVRTPSKPFSSGSDWFNLAISDLPEVLSETKKVFHISSLNTGQDVCVEISLKTADGESMILETWWMCMNAEHCDTSARISYTVYNRMGILLKSLFSTSRVTPAYRLARRQGPETFVICYRVYIGEPQFGYLGEKHQKTKVGTVPTPCGTIALNVAYRTTMLISPHTSRDLSVDLKDDHFTSPLSPRHNNTVPKPCHTVYREQRYPAFSDEALIFGEPQEICNTTFSTSPPDPYHHGNGYIGSSPIARHRLRKPSGDNLKDEENYLHKHNGSDKYISPGHKCGAFVSYPANSNHLTQPGEEEEDDIPFSTLLIYSQPSISMTNTATDSNANQKTCETTNAHSNGYMNNHCNGCHHNDTCDNNGHMNHSTGSVSSTRSSHSAFSHGSSAPDDFVMVELKTPFAGPEGNSELGKFYRECQVAPPLAMFQDSVSIQDTLNGITDQLAVFEANATDFDDFICNLQEASEG